MKYHIGLDVGGMSVKGGIIDVKGTLYAKKVIETEALNRTDEFIGDMAELILDLVKIAKVKKEDVRSVGLGIPGTVNGKEGIVTYACNIGFRNVPLAEILSKKTGIPVYLSNDANCAALGEVQYGSGKGYRDAIMVTLGTGVGSGIILDGAIYEGRLGAGAEAGHMTIRAGGEICGCGRRGCFEAYSSASALIRDTKRAIEENPDSEMKTVAERDGKVSGKTAFEAYKQGDAAAKRLIEGYVENLGIGLVNLVNLFRPEIILLGGGISNEGKYFTDMVERYVNENAYGGASNPYVVVRKAALGNDAGLFGAAALGLGK